MLEGWRRPLARIGIPAIAMLFAGALLLALSAGADEGEPLEPELAISFNMKDDDLTLSPQNKLPDEPEKVKRVNAQYDQIFTIRRDSQPVNVGEWASEPIVYSREILIEEANIWWQEIDEDYSNNGCEWVFYVKLNDETVQESSHDCGSRSDEEPYRSSYSLGTSLSLQDGDVFSVQITYEGYEDVDIFYDNITYDTGYTVKSKPLSFYGGSGGGGSVAIEFTEAWPVDWNTNLKGDYVMLMGMDGYMCDNDQASVSEGAEHEMSNGTIATGTVITWNGVVGNELNIMLHYTQFDHMGGGGNGTNGTTNDPLVTFTIVTTATISDDGGLLGLPGFPLLLAVPALAFAARRRR